MDISFAFLVNFFAFQDFMRIGIQHLFYLSIFIYVLYIHFSFSWLFFQNNLYCSISLIIIIYCHIPLYINIYVQLILYVSKNAHMNFRQASKFYDQFLVGNNFTFREFSSRNNSRFTLRDKRCIVRYANNEERKCLDASLIRRERVNVIASPPFNQRELSVMMHAYVCFMRGSSTRVFTRTWYFYDPDTCKERECSHAPRIATAVSRDSNNLLSNQGYAMQSSLQLQWCTRREMYLNAAATALIIIDRVDNKEIDFAEEVNEMSALQKLGFG